MGVLENVVVERYDAEEEGTESSCALETSISVSETLYNEDAPSSSKIDVATKVPVD